MYPPLCFVEETAVFDKEELEGLSPETRRKITKNPDITVKFKIAEVLKNLIERN